MPGDDTLEQALAGGSPQRVGWFRFYFADERWEWSEQVQQMQFTDMVMVDPQYRLGKSPRQFDPHELRRLLEQVFA